MFYDDTLWHERVALLPLNPSWWMVFTVEGDTYEEDVLCRDRVQSPTGVRRLRMDDNLPGRLGGPAYRLREHPTAGRLREHILRA